MCKDLGITEEALDVLTENILIESGVLESLFPTKQAYVRWKWNRKKRAVVDSRSPNRARTRKAFQTNYLDPDVMTDKEFFALFRMQKADFIELRDILLPYIKKDESMARGNTISGPISPDIRLAMGLRFFSGGSYIYN